MNNRIIFRHLLMILLTGLLLQSCNQANTVYIISGEQAGITEKNLAVQFKCDLELVSKLPVSVITDKNPLPSDGIFYVLGTTSTNDVISDLVKKKVILLSQNFPGSRGGIWTRTSLSNGKEAIVLAGSDVQGEQYAVYDYTKDILGLDPLRYWTGKMPSPDKKYAPFEFGNKVIAPPKVPVLCYFENDVDELANLKNPLLEYDWESYTEMINALVRLKYNAIHLFDMLGRPEFFKREEYYKIRPDYDVRLTYIDSLINYAHDMGMMVMIDLSLGYKFKTMDQDKADCWSKNKEEWISFWKYYFEKTPIGKADIFSLRPRNQVWDWEYKSSCGEDKIEVFNEVYRVLGDLIDFYKPEALKVVTCYSDGMDMFNNDFTPPNDWIIAWSDDGWGGFNSLPEKTKGYKFGTYMHAGYWKNHTIHDPYPEKIDTVMKMMINRFQAINFWEINGQQFRPFLLNIEAYATIANNPDAFNGEAFYREWTTRYFGEKAAVYAVRSMKKLHEAQLDKVGYVQTLSEIKQVIGYLGNISVSRPGTPSVQANYANVAAAYQQTENRYEILMQAKADAEKGQEYTGSGDTFYYDFVVLPVYLYVDLLTFEKVLNNMALLKRTFEETGDKSKLQQAIQLLDKAKADLITLYQRNQEGDKNKRWDGWYDPAKRRPNNGFPTQEMLNDIEKNLKNKL